MLSSSGPPPYSAPLPGWEHLYTGIPPPSDLDDEDEGIEVEPQDRTEKPPRRDDDYKKPIKMRTIKYYDSVQPELSEFGYAWLAKEL